MHPLAHATKLYTYLRVYGLETSVMCNWNNNKENSVVTAGMHVN